MSKLIKFFFFFGPLDEYFSGRNVRERNVIL